MPWTLFVVLLGAWLFGIVSTFTLDGFIHFLLPVALLALVSELVQHWRLT
jgi:hypothetical protein